MVQLVVLKLRGLNVSDGCVGLPRVAMYSELEKHLTSCMNVYININHHWLRGTEAPLVSSCDAEEYVSLHLHH